MNTAAKWCVMYNSVSLFIPVPSNLLRTLLPLELGKVKKETNSMEQSPCKLYSPFGSQEIPRTTMEPEGSYGDVECSILREKPKSRLPIKTVIMAATHKQIAPIY